jgi:hypothetical protein
MDHRDRMPLLGAFEQAGKADGLVDEAIAVGHGRSDPLVVHAKNARSVTEITELVRMV